MIQTEIIKKPEDLNQLIENRENCIIEEVQEVAKNIAKKEMDLCHFEILYSLYIPKKSNKKNSEWVRKTRKKMWKEALKKAGGNEKMALLIYGKP